VVLPLIDEHKPKCYLCHEGFENIEKLRDHQKIKHTEALESHEGNTKRQPAPGDVTVF
jgi:hypothetical protein